MVTSAPRLGVPTALSDLAAQIFAADEEAFAARQAALAALQSRDAASTSLEGH
jgi:hypothetical protein